MATDLTLLRFPQCFGSKRRLARPEEKIFSLFFKGFLGGRIVDFFWWWWRASFKQKEHEKKFSPWIAGGGDLRKWSPKRDVTVLGTKTFFSQRTRLWKEPQKPPEDDDDDDGGKAISRKLCAQFSIFHPWKKGNFPSLSTSIWRMWRLSFFPTEQISPSTSSN